MNADDFEKRFKNVVKPVLDAQTNGKLAEKIGNAVQDIVKNESDSIAVTTKIALEVSKDIQVDTLNIVHNLLSEFLVDD